MPTKIDFYLASYEPEHAFEPKACVIKKRLVAKNRDEFLLIKVIPPFEHENGMIKVDDVVISVRFQGDSLFPINRWPMHVYVCNVLNYENIINGRVYAKDLTIQYWGELYQNASQIR